MERLDWKRISTLARKKNNLLYCCIGEEIIVQWSEIRFSILQHTVDAILKEFFGNDLEKVLGASETDPPKDGLGWYLHHRFPQYTPRHASAIAAILCDLGLLTCRGKRPVYLKKMEHE